MDSAADSLLALSNTAVALAEEDEVDQDSDRSSSLSELDDEEPDNLDSDAIDQMSGVEADSEAETERLEESPDKIKNKKVFGATPSKLAQATLVDDRPEIESLTDSDSDALSAVPQDYESDSSNNGPGEEEEEVAEPQYDNRSPSKRKRMEEEPDEEEQDRTRRRRRGSVSSGEAKSDHESEVENVRSQLSRGGTPEIQVGMNIQEEEAEDDDDEQDDEEQKDESNEESKDKKASIRGRTTRSRGKEDIEIAEDRDVEDEPEVEEESEDVEVDDTEAAAKSEEEQAKRMAAMEALTTVERHFATLRDRLYDERISAINQELAQLAESVPSHPELLKQLEVVRKHRDDKFDVEQKLLVYKVGALKNKSVAERSQLQSAYYQTVRDVRERHLEKLSEHFYRIQRDRFKAETAPPSYAIPFPERRSKQITQQTAYNKEVSILSGVARYVGFPAAPELPQSHQKELENDMQKMGLSTAQIRPTRAPRIPSAFTSTLTAQAAEEQFLEKNAWANAQHPMHKLGVMGQHRNQSPSNENFLTPAHQQRIADTTGVGSASTIVEHPSAPVSSNFNTPRDGLHGQGNAEAPNGIMGHRTQSASPLETRRQNQSAVEATEREPGSTAQISNQERNSSPLTARVGIQSSPRAAALLEGMSNHSGASASHQVKAAGILAGSGYGGGGRFGLA